MNKRGAQEHGRSRRQRQRDGGVRDAIAPFRVSVHTTTYHTPALVTASVR
eukprot:CAMPEP_0181293432 /NCGR_PEP_ID=MMETSP1101-20121128/3063_1 /TAXON_ID=46948 /ORGANISM="Rhodomonas abbreviata, Strain Caron Lab Isolate" /LENGTH=49 /DNA_ID= /DNA_START= /DNA_END= /DNA_ORIENTATION=